MTGLQELGRRLHGRLFGRRPKPPPDPARALVAQQQDRIRAELVRLRALRLQAELYERRGRSEG